VGAVRVAYRAVAGPVDCGGGDGRAGARLVLVVGIILGFVYREFLIIFKVSFIYSGWQFFMFHFASRGGEKPTYKVSCYLCTYKSMDEKRKGETHVRSLTTSCVAWR
jgi:hypothetical protein